MKYSAVYLTILLLPLLFWSGCSKDDDKPSVARLDFDYDLNVGGDELEFGKVYTINGTAISFDVTNFYIGGVKLTQDNGETINLLNQYLLAGIGNTVSINGDLESSDITRAEFFVGVDPLTNAQTESDFTSRPSGDPLAIQDPSMHWNWNTGYKFLRVDGEVDSDGDGTVDTGVAYHLGSDAFLKEFDLSNRISVEGGNNTISFSFDLVKFFEGIDLSTELDTHTGNNLPLAERLLDNLTTAISLK